MIRKIEATKDCVSITLENGVKFDVSCNPEFIHLHFSGIDGRLSASPFHSNTDGPRLVLANYVDITYTPLVDG